MQAAVACVAKRANQQCELEVLSRLARYTSQATGFNKSRGTMMYCKLALYLARIGPKQLGPASANNDGCDFQQTEQSFHFWKCMVCDFKSVP